MRRAISLFLILTVILVTFAGCAATESSHSLKVTQVDSAAAPYSGPKSSLVVGKFDNR